MSLYPEKEVKKGLEQLYRKIEKHLIDDSPLLQVVWRNMQVSIFHVFFFLAFHVCCRCGVQQNFDSALDVPPPPYVFVLLCFQDEFVKQLKHYNELVVKCYPNSRIDLEISVQDVLSYFSQFAMQH